MAVGKFSCQKEPGYLQQRQKRLVQLDTFILKAIIDIHDFALAYIPYNVLLGITAKFQKDRECP